MRLERHWLRESLANRDVSESALGERLSWREEQLARDGEEHRWLREQAAVLEQERDWLREKQNTFEEEAAWLREKQNTLEEEAAWLRQTASNQEQELAWRRETLEGMEARGAELELELKRELESHSTGEKELRERLRQAAEVGLAGLQAQETVIGAELQPLFDGLEQILTNDERPEPEPTTSMEALSASIRRGVARLRAMQDELAWRRSEMQGAIEQSERAFAKLLVGRTGLGRRVELWRRSAEDSESSSGRASDPTGGDS
jgi:chromosome segregation ATPase